MKDHNKTKKQFIDELSGLRSQNATLEKSTIGIISAKLAAEEACHYAESIVETIREPLLVLDADLKIVSANRNFYTTFKVTPRETIGSIIYDLGNKQWDIADLRKLLEEVLPEKQAFDDFEVDHIFQDIGHKIMLLNACRIHRKDIGAKMILLAIEDITERKRLESLLIDSELQYRRLFETASDGIVLLEKQEGKIIHANPATEKMLGYNQKESIGSKLQDIGVSLDMDDFQTTMQNLNKSGIINYRNVTVESKSGRHIDTEIYLVDRAKLVQCSIRDITERKVAKKDLQASEDRYRSLFENSMDAILLTAPDGRIMVANPEACRIFGRTEEDIYQIGRAGLLDQTDPRLKVALEERKRTGRFRGELTFLRENGTHFLGEISSSIFNDHDGRQMASMSIRDITNRKQAEAVLLESEERYRVLFEGSTPGILVTDIETGRFVDANLSICRMLGYSKAELLQLGIADIHPKEIQEHVMQQLDFEKRGGQSVVGTIPCLRKDGTVFYAEIAGASTIFRGERYAVGFFMDITERKQAEEELHKTKDLLAQSEKLGALGRLSAGVAHEILNPVNIISMELQLLQRMSDLPPKVLEELNICMGQIDRVVKIANNLKVFSRVTPHKTVMADINGTISDLLSLYARQLKIEGIETEVQYQSDLPIIAMDKGKIEQVILNLITNARGAMEGQKKKVLRIKTERETVSGDHDYCKVTIADTGTGIKLENMPKIFDPFFTTKGEENGMGLGLSISYGIIKDHGGNIWAENNEWGGASFYIRLPVKT